MVRARIFQAGHRFEEGIGPSAGNYIMGSETEFNKRIAALGYKCFYVAEAVVGHIIREHQLRKVWLCARAFRYGRGLCAGATQEEVDEAAILMGAPRWQLRECARSKWRELTALALGNRAAAMRALWDFEASRGYIREWRARRSLF